MSSLCTDEITVLFDQENVERRLLPSVNELRPPWVKDRDVGNCHKGAPPVGGDLEWDFAIHGRPATTNYTTKQLMETAMTSVDGFVAAVPTKDRETYRWRGGGNRGV
jgi:hypothetical protein